MEFVGATVCVSDRFIIVMAEPMICRHLPIADAITQCLRVLLPAITTSVALTLKAPVRSKVAVVDDIMRMPARLREACRVAAATG